MICKTPVRIFCLGISVFLWGGCKSENDAPKAPSSTAQAEQGKARGGAQSSAQSDALAESTADPAVPAISSAEAGQIVHDDIVEFYTGMNSDDEATRLKAFDDLMPQLQHFTQLFGQDDGKKIWTQIEPKLSMMRQNTDKVKVEMERNWPIDSVEVFDVRSDDVAKKYTEVLQVIPSNLPVFRAVIRSKSTTAGSSAYVLIDGKTVFLQGLDSIPRFLKLKP